MFYLNLFFKLCLIEINKLNININRNKYKVKYSNEYYLKMIYYIFNDINKWSFLSELKLYNSKFKYHYSVVELLIFYYFLLVKNNKTEEKQFTINLENGVIKNFLKMLFIIIILN